MFNMVRLGIFAGGVLFGTAGIKILTSKDAKKVYTNCTAAVLRAKDCVMETVTNVREECSDILADAKAINEERVAEEEDEIIADAWGEEEIAEEVPVEEDTAENPETEDEAGE